MPLIVLPQLRLFPAEITLQTPQIRHFLLQSVYGVVLLHDLISHSVNLFLLSVHFDGQLSDLLGKLYAFDRQIFYDLFQFLHKRKCFFILMDEQAHL